MTDSALATTRRCLHGVAELLLAGPQHRASGRIELRVVAGGFATVAAPALRIDGDELLTASTRVPLNGITYSAAAAASGVEAGEPAGVYAGGPGVRPAETIVLDPAALTILLRAFTEGDRALRALAPEAVPVLWPEHFDVAITLDEVNYGVSAGDDHVPQPYAYVGPRPPLAGEFWNVPFGAAHPVAELGDAAEIVRFFRTGREFAARH